MTIATEDYDNKVGPVMNKRLPSEEQVEPETRYRDPRVHLRVDVSDLWCLKTVHSTEIPLYCVYLPLTQT